MTGEQEVRNGRVHKPGAMMTERSEMTSDERQDMMRKHHAKMLWTNQTTIKVCQV